MTRRVEGSGLCVRADRPCAPRATLRARIVSRSHHFTSSKVPPTHKSPPSPPHTPTTLSHAAYASAASAAHRSGVRVGTTPRCWAARCTAASMPCSRARMDAITAAARSWRRARERNGTETEGSREGTKG